nr:MAG TPA: Protein of unknown function (DUF1011) [Bacteriophage sp.]
MKYPNTSNIRIIQLYLRSITNSWIPSIQNYS